MKIETLYDPNPETREKTVIGIDPWTFEPQFLEDLPKEKQEKYIGVDPNTYAPKFKD